MSDVLTGSAENLTAYLTAAISSLSNNGSGEVRVTTSTPHLFGNGDSIIMNTPSVTTLTGIWIITVISATQFDLNGSSFTSTSTGYASEANLTPQILVPTDGDSLSMQISGMLSALQGIMDRTQFLSLQSGVIGLTGTGVPYDGIGVLGQGGIVNPSGGPNGGIGVEGDGTGNAQGGFFVGGSGNGGEFGTGVHGQGGEAGGVGGCGVLGAGGGALALTLAEIQGNGVVGIGSFGQSGFGVAGIGGGLEGFLLSAGGNFIGGPNGGSGVQGTGGGTNSSIGVIGIGGDADGIGGSFVGTGEGGGVLAVGGSIAGAGLVGVAGGGTIPSYSDVNGTGLYGVGGSGAGNGVIGTAVSAGIGGVFVGGSTTAPLDSQTSAGVYGLGGSGGSHGGFFKGTLGFAGLYAIGDNVDGSVGAKFQGGINDAGVLTTGGSGAGPGLIANGGTGNGVGAQITGTGSANGVLGTSGLTGTTGNAGVVGNGAVGSNAAGVFGTGAGNGPGAGFTGGSNGPGINCDAGPGSNQNGINATGQGNGSGGAFTSQGTSAAIVATQNGTGDGIYTDGQIHVDTNVSPSGTGAVGGTNRVWGNNIPKVVCAMVTDGNGHVLSVNGFGLNGNPVISAGTKLTINMQEAMSGNYAITGAMVWDALGDWCLMLPAIVNSTQFTLELTNVGVLDNPISFTVGGIHLNVQFTVFGDQ